ncbi:MAG: hypothetical protein QXJ45_07510 [Thermoproteota archaeon]
MRKYRFAPRYGAKIRTISTVTKFEDPKNEIAKYSRMGYSIRQLEEQFEEYMIDKNRVRGNIFLNEGINFIWSIVCGATGLTPFNNANAHIGVGDGTAAASPSQTGLQGVNKTYKPMDTGYPIYGSDQKAIFRSTFGANDANYTWNEWTVANGNSDAAINLNRKVESLGTKASGSTWVLEVQLIMS